MKIYFLNLDNFEINKLKNFAGKSDFKNLKEMQHFAGLYLVNEICRNNYNIPEVKIIYKNNKPFIDNSNIFISISHSKNYITVAFSDNNIGIDIEYNNHNRNFVKILNRYKEELWLKNLEIFKFLPKNEQIKIFYDFWTIHEAKIKLNSKHQDISLITLYDIKDFTISVASEKEIQQVEITEI